MRYEIRELTVLRAVAILILMLAHLHDYIDVGWLWKIYPLCAVVCLSLFVFVSGYCLSLSKRITGYRNFLNFIKKRLFRIYPLYLPALCLFILLYNQVNTDKFILIADHFLSLQILLGKLIIPYKTIWFVGLIVPYYFLFALSSYLSKLSGTVPKYMLLTIFFLFLKYIHLDAICDNRFFLYCPSFIIGVYVSEKGYLVDRPFKIRILYIFVIIALCLGGAFHLTGYYSGMLPAQIIIKSVLSIMLIVMIPLLFLTALEKLKNCKLYKVKIIDLISYSSYAVFLFHRPILTGIKYLLTSAGIRNIYLLFPIYILVVFPLVVFPVSYLIQKSVDRLMAAR